MLILTDINDGAIVLNILHLATPSSIIKKTIFIQKVFHTREGRRAHWSYIWQRAEPEPGPEQTPNQRWQTSNEGATSEYENRGHWQFVDRGLELVKTHVQVGISFLKIALTVTVIIFIGLL